MFLDAIVQSRSKTLASYLAMFCFGVGLGSVVPALQATTEVLLVLGVFALGCIMRTHRSRVMLFAITCLLFGMMRLHQAELPSAVVTVADRVGVSTRVEGVVDAEVEKRIDHTRVVLDGVRVADEAVEGKMLVRLPLHPEVSYGDTLVFSCKPTLPEPFNGFAYDRYLAVRGIYAVCSFPQYVDIQPAEEVSVVGMVLGLKEYALDVLHRTLPEPHATFMAGLLFGGNSGLSSELKDDFARTGTSHILAASGFNISLFSLVFLGWILQTRLGRKKGLILTGGLMLAYTITAGATPAVIRAVLMGSVVLVQHVIHRRAYVLNVLLLTAAVMLLANPLLLLDDVGFQLSFAATVAVTTLTTPISRHFRFVPSTLGIREALAGSLAAILVTTPILLWQFGGISLIAPLANLLILPLVPFAMVATLSALVVGAISSTVGVIAALPAWGLSSLMLWVIQVFGAIELAFIEPAFSQFLAAASVLVVVWSILRLVRYDA